jgi:hypothetical protein
MGNPLANRSALGVREFRRAVVAPWRRALAWLVLLTHRSLPTFPMRTAFDPADDSRHEACNGRRTCWLCAGRRWVVMLMTIFVLLLVLWLLGMVSSYTLGGFIHLLLLLAIAVVLIRIIQGRRPV